MPHFGPLSATKATHADHDARVLRALAHGPLTGVELRDEVSPLVKRAAVGYSIRRLVDAGHIAILCRQGTLITYRITDAGRAALDVRTLAATGSPPA